MQRPQCARHCTSAVIMKPGSRPQASWTALIWLRIPKLVRFAKSRPDSSVTVFLYLCLPGIPTPNP
jgi:hypothetical protein